MGKIADVVKPGVVTGNDLQFIFKVAQENNFAIPAVNVVGSSTVRKTSGLATCRGSAKPI